MYKIIRFFEDDQKSSQTVKIGLTLAQAQKHCKDPETSSSTCTIKEAKAITIKYGNWFDGYDEERAR